MQSNKEQIRRLRAQAELAREIAIDTINPQLANELYKIALNCDLQVEKLEEEVKSKWALSIGLLEVSS